jgi:hypothetical protein
MTVTSNIHLAHPQPVTWYGERVSPRRRFVGHIQVSGVERLRDAVNNHGQQARICGAGTRRNGWDTASCQDFLKITKGIKNALARHFEWKALG